MEKEKKIYSLGKPCKGSIKYPNKKIVNYASEEVVDENGNSVFVDVPFDTGKLDLGTAQMYRLEDMLAAGVRPSNIQTSANNRIATHEKIEGVINSLDAIFSEEFENNTQQSINE